MEEEASRPDERWQPEGNTPRSGARRSFLFWCASVVLAIVIVVAGGWYGFRQWSAAQSAARDAKAAGDLHHKLAVSNQPLTGDEFRAALSLCDAADAETRFTALLTATADAVRHHPERKALVVPVAARLVGDQEAAVREKAIKALTGLLARQHIELIRPSLRATDPQERKAAEEAVAVLGNPVAPK